jgi:D-threonine aldolase
MSTWFKISNEAEVDTPAVLVYRDRVAQNIRALVASIDDVSRLRPHIKTHKSLEVCRMLLQAGISKFKCATIAEAEILARAGAKDILLAYQPVGPKAFRLLSLSAAYPEAVFSCLVDNESSAKHLSEVFKNTSLSYFIDVNVGMNRTGIVPEKVVALYRAIKDLPCLSLRGLHIYDGHLRDIDYAKRKQQCDAAFEPILRLRANLEQMSGVKLIVVAGGSPTYPIHAERKEIECSPGTFIYWDKGYEQILPEQKFIHAAIVMTRVISKPAPGIICVDLGHKAIAAENPLPNRVIFLNAPGLEPTGHSEEHMVLKNTGTHEYEVGDALYGVPYHVCPTIALHDSVKVVRDGAVMETWQTESRNRKLEY